MSGYDERKRGMESQLAHDSEWQFRVRSRRNRLFGQWAAEQLGLAGPDATAYLQAVAHADLQEPGDDDLLAKVAADLQAAGHPAPDTQLRQQLATFHKTAEQQLHDTP